MAARLVEVRSVWHIGLDLLTLSSSHFDPFRKSAPIAYRGCATNLLAKSELISLSRSVATRGQRVATPAALQGLDLHLTEFDRSRAVLQGDPAFIEHSVP